MFKLCLRS